jgi:hypothetical protein
MRLQSFSIPNLADDGDIGRHTQESGHQPAQIDLLTIRPGRPGLHVGHVGHI